ncbi:MAG TPA: class I SAM-dependent methyltransferase [Acidimicrobiales bacterium]|nr:class I SAM-dependent methyltransferase [Acidimicrobiales bacterium]
MDPIVDPAIEAYAEQHTSPPGEGLLRLAEETRSTLDAPQMMVGALEGRFLEMLVFLSGAQRVLEIGTFSGYSSISMAAGLPEGGHIVTCDISEKHAEVAKRHIEANGLSNRIEVRVGPALDSLAELDGPFDFVFIDADKGNYANYYEAVLPKLAPGGVIAADNTLWSGRVIASEDQEADTIAIREFNKLVADDPRVVNVMLTVRDGVTLIRKSVSPQL